MTARIAHSEPFLRHFRALLVFAATAGVMVAMTALVNAQTLTDPNPKARTPTTSSRQPSKQAMKSCPAYGPGFVQLPNSDVCVKVGGFVDGGVVGH